MMTKLRGNFAMDTVRGNFAEVSEDVYEEAEVKSMKGFFKWGEVVELKGSKFTIWHIKNNTLTLKLLEHK